MSTAGFRQDMPPPGGYGNIVYERIPLKKPWSGLKIFSLWFGVTAFSTFLYCVNSRRTRKNFRENDDVHVALEPLLIAERDRTDAKLASLQAKTGSLLLGELFYVFGARIKSEEFLTQIYRNREEEAELMKNVPGWKVGTWYGEPLFKTIGGKMMEPSVHEYYAHADPNVKEHFHTYDFWL